MIWAKNRNTVHFHQIHDSVRGSEGGVLYSNEPDGQDPTYSMKSFDADGFTLNSSSSAIHELNKIVACALEAVVKNKIQCDWKSIQFFARSSIASRSITPTGMSVNTKI